MGVEGSSSEKALVAYEAAFRACSSGDAQWLREVLQEQQRISGLLTRAIVSGQPGAVEMLLRAGSRLWWEPDVDGWSPLTFAAVNMDCRVLGILLSREGTGSVLDARDRDGCTALWWANCLGRHEAVGMLIRAGANNDLRSACGTCVWKAVSLSGEEVYRHGIGVSFGPDTGLLDCPWV
jgi:ankyrin repeat protein